MIFRTPLFQAGRSVGELEKIENKRIKNKNDLVVAYDLVTLTLTLQVLVSSLEVLRRYCEGTANQASIQARIA